jgi:hypothetical protein
MSDEQKITPEGQEGQGKAERSYADTLILEFEEAVCDLEHGVGDAYRLTARKRLEKAREDLRQAMTVPAPKDPDDEFLRDQFAMAAMQGDVSTCERGLDSYNEFDTAAKCAYKMADAMLAARKVVTP